MIGRTVLAGVIALAAAGSSLGVTIPFTLTGAAGIGLRTGNEVPAVAGTASGGALGSGISYDTVSRLLSINVGWGSGNGFTNLSGLATMGHIHGPTASAAPASFGESAGVLIGLDTLTGWNPSATNGGFNGSVTLSAAQEPFLLAGRLYINIHTTANSAGEIRGYLVPTPGAGTLLLGAAGLITRRRRR